MIEQIYNYFTIEMLYLWVNLGVLPFWFILIFFPQSQLCKYFVTSIFPIFILTGTYIFMLYKSYVNSYDFINNFNLCFHLTLLWKNNIPFKPIWKQKIKSLFVCPTTLSQTIELQKHVPYFKSLIMRFFWLAEKRKIAPKWIRGTTQLSVWSFFSKKVLCFTLHWIFDSFFTCYLTK